MTIFVKLPPNNEYLLIMDKYFKTRRCPLFRGFTVFEKHRCTRRLLSTIWNDNLFRKKLTRSNRPEVFCKKDVLKNFEKFTEKHLCQNLFFNKVACLRSQASGALETNELINANFDHSALFQLALINVASKSS